MTDREDYIRSLFAAYDAHPRVRAMEAMNEEGIWDAIGKVSQKVIDLVNGVDDDDDSLLGELADAAMELVNLFDLMNEKRN